jgi:hypothetical protein
MGFADVRLCKRLLSHSRSYDEGSILCKIASAKPTLRASRAFAYAALHVFDLASARPSNVRLA